MPSGLLFNFQYQSIDEYLAVCDIYRTVIHKEPETSWQSSTGNASVYCDGMLAETLHCTEEV